MESGGDEIMEKRTLVHSGIIGIAVLLVLAILVLGIPLLNYTPASAPDQCGSESILFTSHVYGAEDFLDFRYTPKDETPATYYVSYEVYEYGSPIMEEHNKAYNDITPANPLVINVSRQRNATYTMNISIGKNDEACPPYQSRVSIATAT
jgi:hypothetical protein